MNTLSDSAARPGATPSDTAISPSTGSPMSVANDASVASAPSRKVKATVWEGRRRITAMRGRRGSLGRQLQHPLRVAMRELLERLARQREPLHRAMPAAGAAERDGVGAGVIPPVLRERPLEAGAADRSLAEVGPPHDAILVVDHELPDRVARLHRQVVDACRGLDVEVRIRVEPPGDFPDVVLDAAEVHGDDGQPRIAREPAIARGDDRLVARNLGMLVSVIAWIVGVIPEVRIEGV